MCVCVCVCVSVSVSVSASLCVLYMVHRTFFVYEQRCILYFSFILIKVLFMGFFIWR